MRWGLGLHDVTKTGLAVSTDRGWVGGTLGCHREPAPPPCLENITLIEKKKWPDTLSYKLRSRCLGLKCSCILLVGSTGELQ